MCKLATRAMLSYQLMFSLVVSCQWIVICMRCRTNTEGILLGTLDQLRYDYDRVKITSEGAS